MNPSNPNRTPTARDLPQLHTGGITIKHPHPPPSGLQHGVDPGTHGPHADATHEGWTHDPLRHTFPAAAQSVQAPPPVPHAALALAEAHPASVQHVVQLPGPHAAGAASRSPESGPLPSASPRAPESPMDDASSWPAPSVRSSPASSDDPADPSVSPPVAYLLRPDSAVHAPARLPSAARARTTPTPSLTMANIPEDLAYLRASSPSTYA
jgi:hypothetical protein